MVSMQNQFVGVVPTAENVLSGESSKRTMVFGAVLHHESALLSVKNEALD
jgi:hypothetical protein